MSRPTAAILRGGSWHLLGTSMAHRRLQGLSRVWLSPRGPLDVLRLSRGLPCTGWGRGPLEARPAPQRGRQDPDCSVWWGWSPAHRALVASGPPHMGASGRPPSSSVAVNQTSRHCRLCPRVTPPQAENHCTHRWVHRAGIFLRPPAGKCHRGTAEGWYSSQSISRGPWCWGWQDVLLHVRACVSLASLEEACLLRKVRGRACPAVHSTGTSPPCGGRRWDAWCARLCRGGLRRELSGMFLLLMSLRSSWSG